jgi:hypothetical protein
MKSSKDGGGKLLSDGPHHSAMGKKDFSQNIIIGNLEDPYVEECLAKIKKDKQKSQKFKEFIENYI